VASTDVSSSETPPPGGAENRAVQSGPEHHLASGAYFDVWERNQASEEFGELRSRFRRFAFPMAIAFLLWYFLFVLLMVFARDWVSTPVFGSINIAFVLAVLQFVSTLVIVLAYDTYSRNRLDGLREVIRLRVEKELQQP
jgi:uncharacterized membrane protein (DUF485 family)